MSTTLQRLTEKKALYAFDTYGSSYPTAGYDTGWTITNATSSLSGENYFIFNRYVMTLIPQSSADVVLECDISDGLVEKDLDPGQNFVFTSVFKFLHPETIVEIELYSGDSFSEKVTKTATAGLWQVVRSELLELNGELALKARIVIKNHGSQAFYFTMPNAYNDTSFLNSPMTLTMKAYMPDFFWEYDSKSVNPHFPFFKFIDACFGQVNDVMQIYADWFEFELQELPYNVPRSQENTKSRLLNPDVFYFEYLEWIWQFVGSRIRRNVYCPVTNNPFVDDEDEYMRWQVRTSSFGRSAGTRQALREAIQFVLSGDKFVAITPNKDDDPWLIGIKTLTSETPGGESETPCLTVLAAAAEAKPLGYKIEHETVDFVTFILDDIENGRLDNAQIVDEPPDVTTEPATSITTTTATINGTGTSNGASSTVTFTWGTDSTLVSGSTTVDALESPLASNASGTAVTAALTGLTPGTTYYFRATITNTNGTADGVIRDFTTTL